jgi:protein TonB
MRIVALAVGALMVCASGAYAQAQPDTNAVAESAVEERPEVVPGSCQNPQYPMQLRQARVEGRVLLRFVVDESGRVDPSTVSIVSATHSRFEAPARQAVVSCRFRPARMADRAVRVMVMTPVAFRLPRS